ncbi:CBS domain-containing protein [Nocardia sp. IBHARD005]|uniref:CBS domain-containing protein n=1 Tax=Nocardia sp. IBHARD005 TaxID=3457765 RepID=UPI00405811B7
MKRADYKALRDTVRARLGHEISVQELLGLFKIRVRSYQNMQFFMETMHDFGLGVEPSIGDEAGGDDKVIVVTAAAVSPPAHTAPADLRPGMLPQRPPTIGDVPSAVGGRLRSVTSHDSLKFTVNLMRQHKFSQIPVIDDRTVLRGVVTWQSLQSLHDKSLPFTLQNATARNAECAETHQELFPRLPIIAQEGFLLVRGARGEFVGIVTVADIATQFYESALPFFMVGSIEGRLRTLFRDFGEDAIGLVQSYEKTGRIDDLTFGEYENLVIMAEHAKNPQIAASADANWHKLGWSSVDRRDFVRQLTRVRKIRNRVAHFSPVPLADTDLDELRQFSHLLDHLV